MEWASLYIKPRYEGREVYNIGTINTIWRLAIVFKAKVYWLT
jgi:hypothetical protein